MVEVERTLALIWKDVFDLPNTNAQDNFLDLGMDSLRAMQIASRVEESLGCRLEVLDIFESPTISALTRRIQVALDGQSPAES